MLFRVAGRFLSYKESRSPGACGACGPDNLCTKCYDSHQMGTVLIINDYNSLIMEIGIRKLSMPKFDVGQMIEFWLRKECVDGGVGGVVSEAYYWRHIHTYKEYHLLQRLINEVLNV